MVQKRALGVAVGAVIGSLALAKSRSEETSDEQSDTPRAQQVLDRASSARDRSPLSRGDAESGRSRPDVRDYIPRRKSSDSGKESGMLSDFSVRAGVYFDHESSDSTFAFEWRRSD